MARIRDTHQSYTTLIIIIITGLIIIMIIPVISTVDKPI